jgi:hypothetical protein
VLVVGVVVVVLVVVVLVLVLGVVVVVVLLVDVTALVSHHLSVPASGSPNVALLQGTPPVNVLGAVKVPFAP